MDAALRSSISRRTLVTLGAWSLLMLVALTTISFATSTPSAAEVAESKSSGAGAARSSSKKNQGTP